MTTEEAKKYMTMNAKERELWDNVVRALEAFAEVGGVVVFYEGDIKPIVDREQRIKNLYLGPQEDCTNKVDCNFIFDGEGWYGLRSWVDYSNEDSCIMKIE